LTGEEIASLSLAALRAMIERHIEHMQYEDRQLRYILYAITGSRDILPDDPPRKPNLDEDMMEVHRRLKALGI
jgi:hypothetical protein